MTQQQYIIRWKLNLVELSSQLGNISEACRKLGVSRQHYDDIKAALARIIHHNKVDPILWTAVTLNSRP